MKQIQHRIADEQGLHARPAGQLVQAAAKFTCDIRMEAGGRQVDAKRVLGVMQLGAAKGTLLTLTFDGPDEAEAAEALQTFLSQAL